MLLEKLVLCDVGLFRGEQSFDLTPRKRGQSARPVVLFGGLNGAGKTTILNSVRHCLYGRQALDVSLTQAGYEAFLRSMIHSPAHQLVKPDRAQVQIQFVYAKLGTRVRYRVTRSWIDRGSTVVETLTVRQDEQTTVLLQGEAAQAFLSQLIPAGVSQFFFFDGEKIAALAKDESDNVLAEAIRRLLGLDTADRLRSDIGVFLRGHRLQAVGEAARKELLELAAQIQELKDAIAVDRQQLENNLLPKLNAAREEEARCKSMLSDRGGAWAVDRKALGRTLEDLQLERAELEERLRDEIAGLAVFSLAPSACGALLEQALKERRLADEATAKEAVSREVERLKAKLSATLQDKVASRHVLRCVDEWAVSVSAKASGAGASLHGFAASDVARLEDSLRNLIPTANGRAQALARRLEALLAELTAIQDQLAHAPSDESIEEVFAMFQRAATAVAEFKTEKKLQLELMRARMSKLVVLLRRRRQVDEQAERLGVVSRAESIGANVQNMIDAYKQAGAVEKCRTLERHFVSAFRRLARKEDILDHAVIDPGTFAVTLVDRHGRATSKQRLSAGEKQIFAIAMLEALAKTSGRNLPIIIDTPLGRLDSKHRAKLVDSYFPVASHQVIVLSTDTEVDQVFYEGMRPNISHAFHLVFDENEGCTTAAQGYFWNQQELRNAA
jgi:DNA sulfur modification protein DndD